MIVVGVSRFIVGVGLISGGWWWLVVSSFVFVFFLFTFDDVVDDSLRVFVVVGECKNCQITGISYHTI